MEGGDPKEEGQFPRLEEIRKKWKTIFDEYGRKVSKSII